MKFMIQRATTRGNIWNDPEEQAEEAPPWAGAYRDTSFTLSNSNEYHPWVIEVPSLADLLDLADVHGVIVGKSDPDEECSKEYLYTITIYDGYME